MPNIPPFISKCLISMHVWKTAAYILRILNTFNYRIYIVYVWGPCADPENFVTVDKPDLVHIIKL